MPRYKKSFRFLMSCVARSEVYRDFVDMETISLCDEIEALKKQFHPEEEQHYGQESS